MVVWETYGLTDVGMHRLTNEDDYALLESEIFYEGRKAILRALAVADGMGGHNAGEVASKLAIQYFAEAMPVLMIYAHRRGEMEEKVRKLIEWINERIYKLGEEKEEYAKMGTTLTAFIVTYTGNILVHVGDSCAYLFHNNSLKKVTKDHTFAQLLADSGAISREEVRERPEKHVLVQCIGVESNVKPDIHWVPLDYNDIIMLCSDGLTDMLSDAEIENTVRENEESLKAICEALLKKALDAGGRDNITIVLGRLRE